MYTPFGLRSNTANFRNEENQDKNTETQRGWESGNYTSYCLWKVLDAIKLSPAHTFRPCRVMRRRSKIYPMSTVYCALNALQQSILKHTRSVKSTTVHRIRVEGYPQGCSRGTVLCFVLAKTRVSNYSLVSSHVKHITVCHSENNSSNPKPCLHSHYSVIDRINTVMTRLNINDDQIKH